jgi:hypothetical protein
MCEWGDEVSTNAIEVYVHRLRRKLKRRAWNRHRARIGLSNPESGTGLKLALFADIHSNLEAITACIAHADALGADRYAFLGDLVGYGADPVAVLDLIAQYRRKAPSSCSAITTRRRWDVRTTRSTGTPWRPSTGPARSSGHGSGRSWRRCPLTVDEDDFLFVHASAAAPGSGST